jgi:hypothetical protein
MHLKITIERRWIVGTIAVMALLAGCTANRFPDAIEMAAQRNGVSDAALLPVTHRAHLRFDSAAKSDLEDVIQEDNLATMQSYGADVLRRAGKLAAIAGAGEIERLPDPALQDLARAYEMDAGPDQRALRARVAERFRSESQAALKVDVSHLVAARSTPEARRILQDIHRAIAPPVGDRGKLGRILATAPLFLPATIGAAVADNEATRRELASEFASIREYLPEQSEEPDTAHLEGASIDRLARWFAPVLVQEARADANYPQDDDQIGQVHLGGTPEKISVSIDTARPVVYWTHAEAKVHDQRYRQLIYVVWYPSRPALEPNDPAVGRIDGVIVRITLDRHNRPAIFEFVRSCGCFHTLWVAGYVEDAARAEFGPPKKGEKYAVRATRSSRGLFLPALIADDGTNPRRPVVYINAGEHLVTAIGREPVANSMASPPAAYILEPYIALTQLPLGEGVASMFGADGLVHNAGRAEGWLLSPTGMLSAGQPRQLGTMKIRMDAYDYDDPRLLERNLRLPRSF